MSYQHLNNLVKQSPELWHRSCPRIIRGADSFGDFSVAATSIAVNLLVNSQPAYNDHTTRRCAEVAVKLLDKNVPAFFLAPDFLRAALASNPPSNLRWSEINVPFEAAVLMLPVNFFVHPNYGSVDFVAFGRFKTGEVVATPERVAQFGHDQLTVFTALKNEPNFPQQMRVLTGSESPTLGDAVFTAEQKFLGFEFYENAPHAKYLTTDDDELMDDLMRLVFCVLLAITARPSLIKRGQRVGRHKKSGLPIWTPNVVGASCRAPTDSETAEAVSSKRLHWRRGHFRQQPIGSRENSQHKIIWIEPVLVGER